jgi:hypothetical protein
VLTPASIRSSTTRSERVAISEVLVGPQRHLPLTVLGSHPRPLDLDAAAAERHRPVIGPVPVGSAIRVVLALRPAHVLDLLSHQLLQHAEPDTDAQRKQSLLRCPQELTKRFLDPRRQCLL